MKTDNKNQEEQQNETSLKATISRGKQAVEAGKKSVPKEDEKKESEQKKDAEQWRNEG